MEVVRGRVDLGVTEKDLDDSKVRAGVEEVRCEAVPQSMDPHALAEPCPLARLDDDPAIERERSDGRDSGRGRAMALDVRPPVGTQELEHRRRERDKRSFLPLPRCTRMSIRSLSMSSI